MPVHLLESGRVKIGRKVDPKEVRAMYEYVMMNQRRENQRVQAQQRSKVGNLQNTFRAFQNLNGLQQAMPGSVENNYNQMLSAIQPPMPPL